MRRTLFALALALACAAAPRVSAADDGSGRDSPSHRDATALFNEGVALAEQADKDGDVRKYEAARGKLLAAHDLVPNPAVLYVLARVETHLNLLPDALHHYRQVLRDPKSEKSWLEFVKRHVAELSAKVATIQLDAPEGADIFVDGVSISQSAPLSYPLDVSPGKHAIEARDGKRTTSQTVDVAAGTSTPVTLEFHPEAPALSPSTASPNPPTPPEAHSSQPDLPPPSPPRGGSSTRTMTLVATGVAAAAAGALGIGYAVASSNAGSQRDSSTSGRASDACYGLTSGPCAGIASNTDARDNDANISHGLFVTAGVFAAGFVVVLVAWPSEPSKPAAAAPKLRLVPSVGQTSTLTLVGTF